MRSGAPEGLGALFGSGFWFEADVVQKMDIEPGQGGAFPSTSGNSFDEF
nr:hypothetical protein [Tabrizicola sp.]